jgi:outer membrane protein insertion porin family
LPTDRLLVDSKGQQIYVVSTGTNAGASTLCAIGYSGSSKDPCVGTSVNDKAKSSIQPFREKFFGDSPSPRLSVGVGVNWNSPFGPFRIDVAKVLLKQKGDKTKLFTFNVGTQF